MLTGIKPKNCREGGERRNLGLMHLKQLAPKLFLHDLLHQEGNKK